MTGRALTALVLVVGTFVTRPARAERPVDEPSYDIVDAFPHLEFHRPVDLQPARDGTNRLFVVEQEGMIHVFENKPGTRATGVFLDIHERVNTDGNEMGMLGLAFHPDFARTRAFFVDYTATKWTKRITRVARFTVGPYPNAADVPSEDALLEVTQPWANHNGGQIAFGPDGFLYVALGDGGSAGDPQGNAQNRASLLGKILRLDVSGKRYTIPADNPFKGNSQGWKEEIYAWGLRNPWRFSFDRATGALWAGDVGQVTWEEIDRIEAGRNYGWDCREGAHPYQPADQRARSCADTNDFVDPVWAYGRSEGISVTGGYVYRGKAFPDLVGWYVYADYGSGRVWALRADGGEPENRLLVDTSILISTFGLDEQDELYLCAHDPSGGPSKIYRLVAK
jgi:glucose/arabinose dehydrogenase